MNNKEELLELIADFMHHQWSRWMKYVYNHAVTVDESSETLAWTSETGKIGYIFNTNLYNRWLRQMNTPYAELSEKEKDSDREWARKLIILLDKNTYGKLHILERAKQDDE